MPFIIAGVGSWSDFNPPGAKLIGQELVYVAMALEIATRRTAHAYQRDPTERSIRCATYACYLYGSIGRANQKQTASTSLPISRSACYLSGVVYVAADRFACYLRDLVCVGCPLGVPSISNSSAAGVTFIKITLRQGWQLKPPGLLVAS